MRFFYYIVMNTLAISLEFLLILDANRPMAIDPITLLPYLKKNLTYMIRKMIFLNLP